MLTNTQSSGLFSALVSVIFITTLSINWPEAQMKLSDQRQAELTKTDMAETNLAKIDLIKTDIAQTDMAPTNGKMLKQDINTREDTRPVERPGPPKPKKPVTAHQATDGFQIFLILMCSRVCS